MDYLDILVKPYWAPRAASRFLELVRDGYYDGVAFNRVVPNFLTQFGIGKDYFTRTKERELTIWDDFTKDIKFEPGTISFAGSGHDSRTTEMFIVMPGTSQEQLNKFGENSWETPFAVIEGDVEKSALTKIYSGYGDMPPFGKGPDSNRIYDVDGYTRYLPKSFPKLDYIDRCYVVEEVGLGDFSEGEF
jgi:peptidyl-prolyl cis-trans isomerase A (cyclophilin A)